jgi:hypothetical protein
MKYVENKNINREKWDYLVSNSVNGFVYSTSNYLDIVCDNWDALIFDDYRVVMPLPYKKKYGIKYIIQPNFSQQLGIIYIEKPSVEIVCKFINFLRNSFLYFAVNLNFDNNNIKYAKYIEKTNLILDLNNSFENISGKFNTNTKRNIIKTKREKFELSINRDTKIFINFFVANLIEKVSEKTIEILENIISYSFKNNIGEIYSVLKNGELLSSVFILKSFDRHIYLAATSSNEGKKLRAMFYLLNSFIETNSGKKIILDFEGSDVDGVKRFYKGFGAYEQNYKHIYKKIF